MIQKEVALENKARKRQMRRAVGSMIFIGFMLLTQAAAIYTFFTWKSLLFVISSTLALGLYVYGLVDVARCGVNDARKFKVVNGWGLIAYIVILLIIDTIFN